MGNVTGFTLILSPGSESDLDLGTSAEGTVGRKFRKEA